MGPAPLALTNMLLFWRK